MITQEKLRSAFTFEFITAKERVSELQKKYSKEQLENNPGPEKWSAAECIAHINATNGGYIGNTYHSLKSAKEFNASGNEYKPRFLMSKFINMMKPENTMKFKAPKVFIKEYDGNFEETFSTFLNQQDELIELVKLSSKYDLKKVKVESPASKFLKLQLGEMFLVVIEHQKRHLAQADRALIAMMEK